MAEVLAWLGCPRCHSTWTVPAELDAAERLTLMAPRAGCGYCPPPVPRPAPKATTEGGHG